MTFEDSGWCPCGVTGDLNADGLCSVCAGAPHHRDCCCPECKAYWRRIAEESHRAAEAHRRQLVCTCGWTGAYIEQHDMRQPSCVVSRREAEL